MSAKSLLNKKDCEHSARRVPLSVLKTIFFIFGGDSSGKYHNDSSFHNNAMRPFLISILTLTFFWSSAQIRQNKIFKRTEYINGNLYQQLFDTIKVSNENIDIYFLSQHF